MSKFVSLIAPLIVAGAIILASSMMIHSVLEARAVVRLDPELQRLAVAYLRDQEERREHSRMVDAANLAAEQNLNPRVDLPRVDLKINDAPKTSPHVKARK